MQAWEISHPGKGQATHTSYNYFTFKVIWEKKENKKGRSEFSIQF